MVDQVRREVILEKEFVAGVPTNLCWKICCCGAGRVQLRLQADVPGATAHLAVHFSNQRAPSSLESEHFLLILESKYLWEDQDRKRSLIVSKLFSLLFQSTRR
jgi:hypothetical protein